VTAAGPDGVAPADAGPEVDGSDGEASDAFRRAGFEYLSPDAKGYLRSVLGRGLAGRPDAPARVPPGGAEGVPARPRELPVGLTVLGADVFAGRTFGAVEIGPTAAWFAGREPPARGVAAPVRIGDDLARAVVQVAYRAAPRRWAEVGDAEMGSLDAYPARERVPVAAADAYPGLGVEELAQLGFGVDDDGDLLRVPGTGPDAGSALGQDDVGAAPVTSALGEDGRPSVAAEETFRMLLADWEGFVRAGVGGVVLPELGRDRAAWRRTRDEWLTGRMNVAAVGDALDEEAARARAVRRALRENDRVMRNLVDD
jgi:hypothetical protein